MKAPLGLPLSCFLLSQCPFCTAAWGYYIPGIRLRLIRLGEEMCDFEHSSEWCESRSLFIASGFGTREAGAPLAFGVFIANFRFHCCHNASSYSIHWLANVFDTQGLKDGESK